MVISEQTYRLVALEDADRQWELHDGQLREKPRMGAEHNDLTVRLGLALGPQLDWRVYRLRINSSHVKRSARGYDIPDVCVIPTDRYHEQLGKPRHLEVYDTPLPLVGEIWSPSTGDYDVDDKIPRYRDRGDREIWRLHPFEVTLTAWRRQADGTYPVHVFRGGIVRIESLPGVTIDLDLLFDLK
ncbi:MAG TPA: Uma2 family endonuclease [Thermomicrobiales bacterium]|jgi:Uma2 family endonuclease